MSGGASQPIWHGAWSLDALAELTRNTLAEHLAIRFTDIGVRSLTAEMPVTRQTTQRMGVLHGGASLALAETVGSLASQMAVDNERYAAVGLDINANHIRPVSLGESVRAVAQPLHLGRSTHVWEVHIAAGSGKLVCIARLTTAIVLRTRE